MKYAPVILLAFVVASCHTSPKTDSTKAKTDSAASFELEKTSCFLHLEGESKRDSSIIHINLNGDSVSGTFNHLPYEKDSRKGTISGLKRGDTISAVWTFMQEGMKDTLSVEFLIKNDALYQKAFGVDENTGRQKLTDTSTFSIKYHAFRCPSSLN